MLERDGKIEESLVKGAQLQVTSHTFKKHSVTVSNQMKMRSRCYVVVVSLLIAAVVLFLVLWIVGLFKKDDE